MRLWTLLWSARRTLGHAAPGRRAAPLRSLPAPAWTRGRSGSASREVSPRGALLTLLLSVLCAGSFRGRQCIICIWASGSYLDGRGEGKKREVRASTAAAAAAGIHFLSLRWRMSALWNVIKRQNASLRLRQSLCCCIHFVNCLGFKSQDLNDEYEEEVCNQVITKKLLC